MNGARSTFKRKGYWLTALAAAVLLAASSGTAWAQVTIKGPSNNTVNEGGTATYTVAVKGYVKTDKPASNVTVELSTLKGAGNGPTTGEDSDVHQNEGKKVSFAVPANTSKTDAVMFSASKTLRVGTNQDPDAEDEKFNVEFTITGDSSLAATEMGTGKLEADGDKTTLTIKDDETQTYVLALDPASQKPTEGTAVTVSLTAVPAHVNGSKDLTVNIDQSGSEWSVTPKEQPILLKSGKDGTQLITIENPANDKNRVDDTVTLTAHSGVAGAATLEDSLTITVADADALPKVTAQVVDKDGKVLATQPTSVEEGTAVMIAVMPLDEDGKVTTADEDLEITLAPTGSADARDYRALAKITITSGQNASAPVDLMAEMDEDVGTEMLVFDATVSGESANGPGTSTSAGVLSLTIEDATTKKITPKASEADYDGIKAAIAAGAGDDGLNPGDTVTLMTSDLFTVMDGYTASYGVSVAGESASASASGESVTINALMSGESTITVTGTASMASSSLLESSQTVSNVAELTFPVTVVDTTLVVTLSADPMEIEAGGATMITATANRAVTAGDGAVKIVLTVVGDGTLDADSITIAMGEMSGSVMLTATESVTVVATGSGVSGLMQVMVTVTDVPEPVPALPLIAQWLLGLGLMGGGARQLFRRRRQGS